jgi:CRP/FNR family cyclic AMP-dependent transcriptional regulator
LGNEIDYLKKVGLFSSLTDEELLQISDKMIVKQFEKNEIILYENDTNEYMYIILKGNVRVVQNTEDGKEILLALHNSGEFFGEMSLIDGKTSPATVVATEYSTIAIISKKNFFASINTHEKVRENLLMILSTRLRESWETIQMLNLKDASQRIKILFLMLADKYGNKTTEGITLNFKLTHQEIANMTRLTRETVTRVIDKWQKTEEIIILKNKLIHLNNKFIEKI